MRIQIGDNVTAEGIPLAEVAQIVSLSEIDPDYPDLRVVIVRYGEEGEVKYDRYRPGELRKPATRQDEDPLEMVNEDE